MGKPVQLIRLLDEKRGSSPCNRCGAMMDWYRTLGDKPMPMNAGAVAVRLGPKVLRTSTAAAVALGALGVLNARWSID